MIKGWIHLIMLFVDGYVCCIWIGVYQLLLELMVMESFKKESSLVYFSSSSIILINFLTHSFRNGSYLRRGEKRIVVTKWDGSEFEEEEERSEEKPMKKNQWKSQNRIN